MGGTTAGIWLKEVRVTVKHPFEDTQSQANVSTVSGNTALKMDLRGTEVPATVPDMFTFKERQRPKETSMVSVNHLGLWTVRT